MKDFTLDDIKRLIDNPHTYDATGDEFLDNRFEKSHNRQPYYRFFYHLARWLHPKFVVELGGYQGTAAAHFAADCPDATVVTIDHHTDPGDDFNKAMAEEVEYRFDNVYYVQGWTNQRLANREKGKHHLGDAPNAYRNVLSFELDIDILFIDSWHQYTEAMYDWFEYQPILSSPSLVICDDIIGGYGPAIGGMLDFWNELPGEKFLNDTLHPGYPMGFLRYE